MRAAGLGSNAFVYIAFELAFSFDFHDQKPVFKLASESFQTFAFALCDHLYLNPSLAYRDARVGACARTNVTCGLAWLSACMPSFSWRCLMRFKSGRGVGSLIRRLLWERFGESQTEAQWVVQQLHDSLL